MFSDYARTLKNWGTLFPKGQIFVGFLEDVHFYPNRLLARLYRFLGVDPSANYRVIRRKIHSRDVEKMPTGLAVGLAKIYLEDVRTLEERFGGYASFWRYCAERLASSPPEEQFLPYPLWESAIWDEWTEARTDRPRYQSGPLHLVKTLA
jgi:hypothetical protein